MKKQKEKIVIYGGSFNPPCRHHIQIAEVLTELYDLVIIVPCGPRSEKPTANIINPRYRGEMAKLAFGKIPRVQIDLYDIKKGVYTPTYILQERYEQIYSQAEIWHAVGSDLVKDGAQDEAEIQTSWTYGETIWRTLRWVVIHRPGKKAKKSDMPPRSAFVEIKGIFGSVTLARERISRDEPVGDLLTPEIEKYIRKNGIYQKP